MSILALKEGDSSIETIKLPLADGGEGTLDVLGSFTQFGACNSGGQ